MRQVIKSVAVAGLVAAGLALAGTAQAGGKGHSGPSHGSSFKTSGMHSSMSPHGHGPMSYKNYPTGHGVKFNQGYYYPGKYHNHWSKSCWLPSYGCTGYWCPSTQVWYYWCQPDCCYYPVSYCPYGKFCW